MEFLQKVFKLGVRNFEMEAPVFGALTHHAGIKGAIICASLVNRLNGDQVSLHLNLNSIQYIILFWAFR